MVSMSSVVLVVAFCNSTIAFKGKAISSISVRKLKILSVADKMCVILDNHERSVSCAMLCVCIVVYWKGAIS